MLFLELHTCNKQFTSALLKQLFWLVTYEADFESQKYETGNIQRTAGSTLIIMCQM